MAKKEEKKPTLERIYIIPLRASHLKSPMWKRSKKAVKTIREFIQKHMKSDNVKILKSVNEFIWARGNRKPPARVKVIATKFDDVVKVELFEAKKEEPKQEKKEEPKKEEAKEKKEEPKKEKKPAKKKAEKKEKKGE